MMMIIDSETLISPTSIHRAIDQAAALKIELQRLRHQIRNGTAVDDDRLAWMEQVVDQLAGALVACRDEEWFAR